MHNGCIGQFSSKIKRRCVHWTVVVPRLSGKRAHTLCSCSYDRLQSALKDDFFHIPQGQTDSEWSFALYLQLLSEAMPGVDLRTKPTFDFAVLRNTMFKLIHQLNAWATEAGATEPSMLNFAISDGYSIVASRYISSKTQEAASLVR